MTQICKYAILECEFKVGIKMSLHLLSHSHIIKQKKIVIFLTKVDSAADAA